MSVETAIWKMTQEGPVPLEFAPLGLEASLEDMLAADPSMLGLDLLVVGRQVATAYAGFVDILGLDADAQIHVIELKRDRTPRDVVAQALDYGAWAAGLTREGVSALYGEHGHDAETLRMRSRSGSPSRFLTSSMPSSNSRSSHRPSTRHPNASWTTWPKGSGCRSTRCFSVISLTRIVHTLRVHGF